MLYTLSPLSSLLISLNLETVLGTSRKDRIVCHNNSESSNPFTWVFRHSLRFFSFSHKCFKCISFAFLFLLRVFLGFPGSPVVKEMCPEMQGWGSIPGKETKIPMPRVSRKSECLNRRERRSCVHCN